MNWQDLKGHEDYEICTEYPYQIHKRSYRKILSESIHHTGYYQVRLNGKFDYKHRIIAEQFIPNDDPDHKIQVDHKNRNRTDNHISNLRWCTHSENRKNQSRTKYKIEYVDELPDKAFEVHSYGKHDDISDLFFHDDTFYVHARNNRYKIVNKHRHNNGKEFIDLKLPNGLRLVIFYNKFKQEYDLD